MKLITSHEAIAFLSKAAPKAWVQRLLKCMIVDGEIEAFFSEGRIQPFTYGFYFTSDLREEAGENSGPKMDAIIRKKFAPKLADQLAGGEGLNKVNDEQCHWQPEYGPEPIDLGWIFFAEEIDWEKGSISVPRVPTDRDTGDWMFPSREFFDSEFENAEYEAEFQGMAFNFAAIEMLLPNSNLGQEAAGVTRSSGDGRRVGRPPKWDWEGSISHVVAKAQTPDGLPTGPGAQARIEEMISEWFIGETGDSPSSSQIRQRASKIVRSLESAETPKKH